IIKKTPKERPYSRKSKRPKKIRSFFVVRIVIFFRKAIILITTIVIRFFKRLILRRQLQIYNFHARWDEIFYGNEVPAFGNRDRKMPPQHIALFCFKRRLRI